MTDSRLEAGTRQWRGRLEETSLEEVFESYGPGAVQTLVDDGVWKLASQGLPPDSVGHPILRYQATPEELAEIERRVGTGFKLLHPDWPETRLVEEQKRAIAATYERIKP